MPAKVKISSYGEKITRERIMVSILFSHERDPKQTTTIHIHETPVSVFLTTSI